MMSHERTGVTAVRLITEPLEIPKKLNKLEVVPVISVLWILGWRTVKSQSSEIYREAF